MIGTDAKTGLTAVPRHRVGAMGLLGDCDLRWLTVVGLLCAVVLHFVAGR